MASHSPCAQRHSSKTIGMQGVPIDWQTNIERWTLVLRTADRAEGTIKTRTGHIAQAWHGGLDAKPSQALPLKMSSSSPAVTSGAVPIGARCTCHFGSSSAGRMGAP